MRGLPRAVRLHELRHTCATLMLSQGVDPKIAQQALGHATIVAARLGRALRVIGQEASPSEFVGGHRGGTGLDLGALRSGNLDAVADVIVQALRAVFACWCASWSCSFSEPQNASRHTVGLPERAVTDLRSHRRRQAEEKRLRAGSEWQDNGSRSP